MICGGRETVMSQSLRIATKNKKSVNWWHQQTRWEENSINRRHRLQKRKDWQLIRYYRGWGSEYSFGRWEVVYPPPCESARERGVASIGKSFEDVVVFKWKQSFSSWGSGGVIREEAEGDWEPVFSEHVYLRMWWRNGTSGWIRLVSGCDSPC